MKRTSKLAERARQGVQDLYDRAARYENALRKIKALPKTHDGDKGEREQNDLEDAFTNGCEVGTFEGYQIAAKIAGDALK